MKANVRQRETAYEQEMKLRELIEAYWDERSGDFSRLRLYEEIKTGLIEFMENCDKARRIEESRPNSTKQNAMMTSSLIDGDSE